MKMREPREPREPRQPRDPYAPLKEGAWREVAQIDERLDRGDIDEQDWFDAMSALVTPAYLAAQTPWQGSGKSGTARDWTYSRSLVADAIDRAGSFLDVGCANGYLLETLPAWTRHELDVYGLDISAKLAALARHRLPELAQHINVGNALSWQSGQRFAYVRMNLDYVPAHRRRQLFENLLAQADRVIVGVFNEQLEERPTEQLVRSWGYAIAGRSERLNLRKPQMDYRVLWVDSDLRASPISEEGS
jgi:SAM-dependent methyltransferase